MKFQDKNELKAEDLILEATSWAWADFDVILIMSHFKLYYKMKHLVLITYH